STSRSSARACHRACATSWGRWSSGSRRRTPQRESPPTGGSSPRVRRAALLLLVSFAGSTGIATGTGTKPPSGDGPILGPLAGPGREGCLPGGRDEHQGARRPAHRWRPLARGGAGPDPSVGNGQAVALPPSRVRGPVRARAEAGVAEPDPSDAPVHGEAGYVP